jgi:DNA helicase-2/ATP-dependent DNA helicase PcrA
LLDGHDGRYYDHIIVDEAQDISPLYFKMLFDHSRAGSITAFGDLAQGIYPFHGARRWEDLTDAVDEIEPIVETLNESYRSTAEIIEYANAMQRRIGVQDSGFARPIARSGPEPNLHFSPTRADQAGTIADLVLMEHDNGRRAIAIICKTVADCQELMEELGLREIGDVQIILDQQADYAGGTAILPIYFTKGLEFDTVVLADANEENYAAEELNARLLYVAITRASHSLHICWVGALTPFLDSALTSVEMQLALEGKLEPRLVTIEQYASAAPGLDADKYVERLAGADRLEILSNGRIDETVLDVFIGSKERDLKLHEGELSGDMAAYD